MTKEKYYFHKLFSKKSYKFTFDTDKKVITIIQKHLKKGKILDLGCGEGGTALALAELGYDVTAIDISPTAIENIKKEAVKRKIKIKALSSDIEQNNIKKNYDIILGLGIFHFITKNKLFNLLEQIKSHTNKNGLNIFEVFLEKEKYNEGYYFKKNELKKIYSDWKIEKYKENREMAFLVAKKIK